MQTPTPRLQRYLATLERRPFVADLKRVAAAIRSLGIPVEAWILEVHERFAGYVEPLWKDEAVYGVYHEHSKWLDKGGIDGDDSPGDWAVSCADAHPSYDFNLYYDRSFLGSGCGGPSDSFEQKLEKDALWHEFVSGRKIFYVRPSKPELMKPFLDDLLEKRRTEPDAASDSFQSFFVTEDLLIDRSSDRDVVRLRSPNLPSWIPAGDFFLSRAPFGKP